MIGKHSVLPDRLDLSKTALTRPAKAQGDLQSCTAFAVCAALEGLPVGSSPDQDEAERFIWYNSKFLRGKNPAADLPVNLGAAIKAVQEFGSCWESSYTKPYLEDPLAAPSKEAYEKGSKMKVRAYVVDPDTNSGDLDYDLKRRDIIKQVLHFTRRPVLISVKVTATNLDVAGVSKVRGALAVPGFHEETNFGHSVIIVGYDEEKNHFKFKNSYGPDWGDNGYGYLPFKYLELAGETYLLYDQGFIPDQDSAPASSAPSNSQKGPRSDLAEQYLTRYFRITPGKQPNEFTFF
jgi:C1A family cysteine protease